jgi:hypothetical protein
MKFGQMCVFVTLLCGTFASGQNWQDCKSNGGYSFSDIKTAVNRVTNSPTISGWDTAPSPIIIPLDGGDYSDAFTDADGSDVVYFDYSGNGRKVWMSWIQKGKPYGFLVLFRDAKGNPDPNWQTDGNKIDSIRKMFGNLTKQSYDPETMPLGKDGLHHPNGFLALREFDKCAPEFRKGGACLGTLNNKAQIWSQMRVWVDTNMTADSSQGKLYTLDELGITEIELNYVEENREDRYGNKLAFKGAIVQRDHIVPIYDVFFRGKPNQ